MTELYLGIMSGTSMDGIDVVAVDFSGTTPRIHANYNTNLPVDYKNKYLQIINSGSCSLQELGELDAWSGELFAQAVLDFIKEKKLNVSNIAAIGSHGQTIWHAPNAKHPFTTQLGDPNIIAARTGIKTIADLRRADIAAGGQGAPFAPAFHQAVFANPNEAHCIVNIGGISNISILEHTRYLGFDIGPGNVLLDYWTAKHFDQPYDKDGLLAKSGKVIGKLLDLCLSDPYFKLSPPKSSGREYFNAAWLKKQLEVCGEEYPPINVLTTLVHLTACTISTAIKTYAQPTCKVFICGGGAYNPVLLSTLSILLEQEVYTTAKLGIEPHLVEGALIAWLAKQRLAGEPINLTTGSAHPVLLGGIYEASR